VTDIYDVSDSITFNNYITVTEPQNGNTIPFIEDFESGIFPNISRGIYVNNPDGGVTWELDSNAATSGKYSVKINNLINTNYGTVDEIIFPPFDLQSMTNPVLTFNWAYAKSDPNYSDELIVQLSTDCGASFNQVFYKTGTGLETAPPQSTPFIPDSTQWKTANINLWLYKNYSNVLVKIVNVTDGGNNLYIDDINFNGDSLLYSNVQNNNMQNISFFPNPATNVLYFTTSFQKTPLIKIFDISGKLVLNAIPVNGKLDIQHLSKGAYIVHVLSENQTVFTQKLLKL
jgi:hypothetical protein